MSRKAKNLRAWLFQNRTGTLADAWQAGWDSQKGLAHAQTIQDRDNRITELEQMDKHHQAVTKWQRERIAELEEEIKRLSRIGVALHEAKHQIAELEDQLNRPVLKTEWQQAQDRIAELEADIIFMNAYHALAAKATKENSKLIAQLAEAEKDADRYRWLEVVTHYTDSEDGLTWAVIDYNFGPSSLAESSLSAAIDAAMELNNEVKK